MTDGNKMITDVKLRLIDNGTDGLVGWVSIVIGGAVKLTNIGLRRGRDGHLFLTYPARVSPGGNRHNYFHPISVEASAALKDAVLARLASLAIAAAAPDTEDPEVE